MSFVVRFRWYEFATYRTPSHDWVLNQRDYQACGYVWGQHDLLAEVARTLMRGFVVRARTRIGGVESDLKIEVE